MLRPINRCPLCDGQLEPVKLRCSSCETTLEGRLPMSRLALLSAEQQHFVEAFLVARGNIKEVERELGISYPTVRKKLDEVVQALGHAPAAVRREQEEILEAIERNDLSPQEGIAAIKALRNG
jgi:hypothetical protein